MEDTLEIQLDKLEQIRSFLGELTLIYQCMSIDPGRVEALEFIDIHVRNLIVGHQKRKSMK